MNIFKGMIKCKCCGKNFNYKPNNGTINYLCQTRKNSGVQACNSMIVKETFLTEIIEKHCKNLNKDFSISKLKLFVRHIEVDEENITIYYKDGSLSEITPCKIVF